MLFRKLRYFSRTLISVSISVSSRPSFCNFFNSGQIYPKPTSHHMCFSVSSTGLCSMALHSRYRGKSLNLVLPETYSHCSCKWFSVSSSSTMEKSAIGCGNQNQVSEVIDLIKIGGSDLESKLNAMGVSLSADSIAVIFGVLNLEKVSALPFYCWVRKNRPKLCYTSDVCSLVVDNCGMLGDYDAILSLLKEFGSMDIELTKKAFRFLAVSVVVEDSDKNSVRRVVQLLMEVGGPCSVSGVRALIEMFNSLGSFEMAKFVIEITGRKVSCYDILIKEMCHRLDFRRARSTLYEMRQAGCQPSVHSYNVLISYLVKSANTAEACEVLEEMNETGCPPNSLTFEIFISKFCQQRKFDLAFKALDQMGSLGLEPRVLTHAAFIQGFFKSRRYKEAYCYVVRACNDHPLSSNVNFSLLARLHLKRGNLIIARDILVEMIGMGLRPQLHVYTKVLNQLQKSGRGDLARDLEYRFSSLG